MLSIRAIGGGSSWMGACCVAGAIGVATLGGCAATETKSETASMDLAAMEAAYMKAGMPGAMHEHLAQSVGTWDGQVKSWAMAGAPAETSTCVTTNAMVFDGRYLRSETKGDMMMGGHKMTFEEMGLYGFDNVRQRFENTWINSMSTCAMRGTGMLSADKKTMTWTMIYADALTGKDATMREVDREMGPNTSVMELYGAGPDGKEFKMMEITSTRRGSR